EDHQHEAEGDPRGAVAAAVAPIERDPGDGQQEGRMHLDLDAPHSPDDQRLTHSVAASPGPPAPAARRGARGPPPARRLRYSAVLPPERTDPSPVPRPYPNQGLPATPARRGACGVGRSPAYVRLSGWFATGRRLPPARVVRILERMTASVNGPSRHPSVPRAGTKVPVPGDR